MSRRVSVVEVGPRDGLQNEKQPLSTEFKLQLIHRLDECGFGEVEVTSMVHPKWVPQLADAADLLSKLKERPHRAVQTVLVPNLKGLERALESGAQRGAVFIAAPTAPSRSLWSRPLMS